MRYIEKSSEPENLRGFRISDDPNWNPGWKDLDSRTDIKRSIHETLVAEQGFICCYCERRITRDESHIEHIKPRSRYPDDSLDYGNLLASCMREMEKRKPRHCGMRKDNWYDESLFISPTDSACEGRFGFTGMGQIYSLDDGDAAANETIDRLGLDIRKLRAKRKGVLDAFVDDLNTLSRDDRQRMIDEFQIRDRNGMLQEFCSAIVYLLRNY